MLNVEILIQGIARYSVMTDIPTYGSISTGETAFSIRAEMALLRCSLKPAAVEATIWIPKTVTFGG